MTVWDSLIGQEKRLPIFQRAVLASREMVSRRDQSLSAEETPTAGSGVNNFSVALDENPDGLRTEQENIDLRAMSHAWLLAGPPGSGRSRLAVAFAAALQCSDPKTPGCGKCHDCRTVLDGSHPDVTIVTTQRVIISIDEVTELVGTAQQAPSQGKWRVIVMEDADRMVDRTANLLLKAIEEPPPRTVWILCAPQPQDLLQTIRSRCRQVTLSTPKASEVARLLVEENGIDPQVARQAAVVSQSHIGLARGLAADPEALADRRQMLLAAVEVKTVAEVVRAADRIVKESEARAKTANEQLNQNEKEAMLKSLGVEDPNRIPAAVRSQIKNLEEDQKRRMTRSQRDALDRVLQDLLGFYRDVLVAQLAVADKLNDPLINLDLQAQIKEIAATTTPAHTEQRINAIQLARERINANVRPILALEALLLNFRPPGK